MCAKVKLSKKEQPVLPSTSIELSPSVSVLTTSQIVGNRRERDLVPKSISIVTIKEKTVCSKIEHTTPHTTSPSVATTSVATNMVHPALAYRMRIDELGESMYKEVVRITEGNMLNAKLALWEAIRRIERDMKEGR